MKTYLNYPTVGHFFATMQTCGQNYPVKNTAEHSIKFLIKHNAKEICYALLRHCPEFKDRFISMKTRNGMVLIGGQFPNHANMKDLFYRVIQEYKPVTA